LAQAWWQRLSSDVAKPIPNVEDLCIHVRNTGQ
jgi:hypothetical protein